jgi:hypothetical protein
MFRIDGATAAPSLPTPAAAGTPGYFTEGNPTAGTPATNVTGDWLNMMQEELMSLLTAAGLTPSKTTFTQVRDAIKAIAISQFTQNLATPGYVKLPNGLILQWGQAANVASSTTTTTFPIAFPTTCLAVTGSGFQVAFGVQAYIVLNGKSVNSFTWGAFASNSGTAPATSPTANQVQNWWFAIGY